MEEKIINKIYIIIGILIILFGYIGIKATYSIRPSYTATFHQAWGEDGNPHRESENLPKSCNTKYGKEYFDKCIDKVGICSRWSTQPNGGGGYGGAPDSYHLKDLHYDKFINKFQRDQDFYCIPGTSQQPDTPLPSVPKLISISGKKIWNDNNNQDGIRPESVIIELYDGVNPEPIDSIKITAKDNWQYKFDDLLEEEWGKKYNYYVKEKPISGYSTKIDGYNIINTHELKKKDITITKVWQDKNDKDGIRPSQITIELYNGIDEKPIKVVDITAEQNWQYTFKDLPDKVAGKETIYTIKEKPITGYETTIDGYTITNNHTPIDNPKTGNVKSIVIWTILMITIIYSIVCFKNIDYSK